MPKVEIPLTALQVADEEGVMVAPEVGDAVSFTIDGSVGIAGRRVRHSRDADSQR